MKFWLSRKHNSRDTKNAWQEIVAAITAEEMQRGSVSSNVQRLQLALPHLSLYDGAISGYFDAGTELAVKALQKQLALSETGIFDMATWYALTFWAESELISPAAVETESISPVAEQSSVFSQQWDCQQ